MWQSYVNGLLVAFGLIMAIGTRMRLCWPRACVVNTTSRWRRSAWPAMHYWWPPGFSAWRRSWRKNPTLLAIARWGGAAFLLWYGTQALRRACSKQSLQQGESRAVRSLRAVMLSALAVTLLNPHVYLDTVLLIGSLGAQQTEPGAYVVGAASASLLWFFTLALGAAWLAPWLARPSTWRIHTRPVGGRDDVCGQRCN